tara:strand:+ start:158 stop:487 length:330 start_codon:yes stop_codon:yes gene_type:complete
MNKEEFYDHLNALIEELSIDYAQRLRGVSEDILKKVEDNIISADEIAIFLKEQESLFLERLEEVIEDIKERVEEINTSQDEMKKGIFNQIKDSFAKIYESMVSRLSDLF